MKQIKLFFTVLLMGTALFSHASSYEETMLSMVTQIDSIKSVEDAVNLEHKFERIGEKESNQWLPFYYAALLNVYMNYMDNDNSKIQSRMDKADALVSKAYAAGSVDSSEMYCMQSMISTVRILENPVANGMKYGGLSEMYLKKAAASNPSNPRVYLLSGESYYYRPVMFGGSKKKAMEYFKKALDRYQNFQLASPISPNWGKNRLDEYLEYYKSKNFKIED